jgi:hypothetical protein
VKKQNLERRKDRTDFMTFAEKINSLAKSNKKDIIALKQDMYRVNQALNFMIEFTKLDTTMQQQDEQDRNSVALWGANALGNNQNARNRALKESGFTNEELINITHRHSSSFINT